MSGFAVQPGQVTGVMALAGVHFTEALTTAFCHPHNKGLGHLYL